VSTSHKFCQQELRPLQHAGMCDLLQLPGVWWSAVFWLSLCATRAASYALGRSLWTAETWVANSVCADTVREMVFYRNWLQTTPPLFLFLVRKVVQVFGLSNYTFRAAPFALHIASILIMAVFARQAFRPCKALLCVALVAMSPTGIRYSDELKQYTGDAAVSALLLLLLWRLVERDKRALPQLLITFPIFVFFSQTSVFFIPLITGTILFARPQLSIRTRLFHSAFFSFIATAASAIDYWLFVRPNISSHLTTYWAEGFPSLHSWKAVLSFYTEYIAGIPVYFYLTTQAKDELKKFFYAAHVWQLALLFAPGLAVCLLILFKLLKRPKRLYLVAVFVAPLSALALLNALHFYPVSARRLLLFMLPPVAAGITIAAEMIWELVSTVLAPSTRRFTLLIIPTGILFVAALLSVSPSVWRLPEGEDIESAVRYLATQAKPDDVVFVQGSVSEGEILYSRMLGWKHGRTILGESASACCPRNARFSAENSNLQLIQGEVDRAASSAQSGGTLWFLSSNHPEYWAYLGLDAKTLQMERIMSDGCVLVGKAEFWNMYVGKFQCPGPSRQ